MQLPSMRFGWRWLAVTAFIVAVLGGLRYSSWADDTAKPADDTATAENPYPGRFPAPGLEGGVDWLNTSGPIELRDLKGKVVVLDFWTYCCINCIHILPDLKYLEEKYPNELVVIGVHSAKFENEKITENIRQAVMRYEIAHPVVNDANMTIARKYMFNSWPTLIVIDPEGNFVGRTSGEGQRELMDHVVGKLVEFHRKKGTLDETPIKFDLEKFRREPTPLRYPGKLITDEPGNRLFISDSNNNRIVVTTLDGELLDVIGSGVIGSADGTYDVAQFDHPQGMVLVGETLYVADTENHLLRTVDLQTKSVATLAGTGVQANFRATGGNLRSSPLNSPWDLTHLEGTIGIAMAGPHQLWKHRIGSQTIEPFAGSGREDIIDGTHEAAALAQPSGITHDGKHLYVVDSEGSAVRRVTTGAGGKVTTLVGPHDLPRAASLFEFGDIDGVGAKVRLQHPIGLVYHNNSLYVTDSYNHKIKHIDIATRTCTSWLGTDRGNGLEPVQMNEPAGVAVAKGQLYIADTNNHRILVTDLQTKATRELNIPGLQPPAPPEVLVDNDDDLNAAALPNATAVVGQPLAVSLEFTFAEGYKLNTLSKVLWKLDAVGDQGLIAADQLGVRHEAEGAETTGQFAIPIQAAGSATYDLTVTYQYCRDGEGGVCKLGRAKFRLPLTASAEGTPQPLTLTVQP